MTSTSGAPRPRWKLRNLDVPQKLLIVVILVAVGFGYLAAMANMFAQISGADGHSSVTLGEFSAVYGEKGLFGLAREIRASQGIEDVIATFYGSGPGVTRMEAALRGVMLPIMVEEQGDEDTPEEETRKFVEKYINEPLIAWSHLPLALRKKAYEDGVPLDEDDNPDFEKLKELFGPREEGAEKPPTADVELEPLIKNNLNENCVYCHGPGGEEEATPMTTFAKVDKYSVENRGMSYRQLAMTTHVHLLGFSVLFAMTGFLFSLTSYPALVRVLFVPWTLSFQLLEIACWWLAKTDIIYAKAVFYLGPVVGFGLAVQVLGTLLDLLIRRPERPAD